MKPHFLLLLFIFASAISCNKPAPEPIIEPHIARLGKILGHDLMPSETEFEFIKTKSADPKLITSAQVDTIEIRVQNLGIGVRGIILGDEKAKIYSYYGWWMAGDTLKLGINDINKDVRIPRIYYWLLK